MNICVRADCVEIEGYVNAIERPSKRLWSRLGEFVERICKGAFKKALDRNDNVRILLNHDPEKDLGGTKDGNLELEEDNIGLHARATIKDADVVKKARNGELSGWSFGFMDRDVENKRDEDGFPLRVVHDLDLIEVSLLDRNAIPAYDGTLVSVRADEKSVFFSDAFTDDIQIREVEEPVESVEEVQTQAEEPEKQIDYGKWDELVKEMKS